MKPALAILIIAIIVVGGLGILLWQLGYLGGEEPSAPPVVVEPSDLADRETPTKTISVKRPPPVSVEPAGTVPGKLSKPPPLTPNPPAQVLPPKPEEETAPQENITGMTGKPKVLPFEPAGEYYTVKENDSLWKIAGEKYGAGAKCKIILEANRDKIKYADEIFPGWVLFIPKLPPETEHKPKYHTVQAGDTLSGIASKYYKDGSKSDLILQANRDKLATKETSLKPGWKLVIPPLEISKPSPKSEESPPVPDGSPE